MRLGGLEGPAGRAEGIYCRRSGEHESQAHFCHFHARSVEGGAQQRGSISHTSRGAWPLIWPGPISPHKRCLGTKCHSIILITLTLLAEVLEPGLPAHVPQSRRLQQRCALPISERPMGCRHTRTHKFTHTVTEAHSLKASIQRKGSCKAVS